MSFYPPTGWTIYPDAHFLHILQNYAPLHVLGVGGEGAGYSCPRGPMGPMKHIFRQDNKQGKTLATSDTGRRIGIFQTE